MLHIPPTNLLLIADNRSHTKKAYRLFLTTSTEVRRMSQQAEKRYDRKSNRTQQKNKKGDSKVETNESPEIPDRGEASDIPGLPSASTHKTTNYRYFPLTSFILMISSLFFFFFFFFSVCKVEIVYIVSKTAD